MSSKTSKSASIDKQTGRAVVDGDSSPVPNRTGRRASTAKRTVRKVAPEFTRTYEFIRRYSVLPTEGDYLIATVWAMGTWTFSPACPAMPYTYPYLYLTGSKGSGKTVLGAEVFSYVTRNHKSVVSITGPALFRMIGNWDQESGEIIPHYPTLALDEIDATYAGSKNEELRGPVNAGYKLGNTVPRSAGKTTIEFPVYCPKILMGIDNGHLPDTILDRSIRIGMRKATPEELSSIEELYSWDVEDEAAEMQQELSSWAKREAMVLRDYKPAKIEGLSPRQWEIARSLVQLAHAIGNEDEVRTALFESMTRNPEKEDSRVILFRAIMELFDTMPDAHADRLTATQIVDHLVRCNVPVPGNSKKGLSSLLKAEGIHPDFIRLRPGHPGKTEDMQSNTARGYYRNKFDEAFVTYLMDEDED